jgi:hypothetical protein
LTTKATQNIPSKTEVIHQDHFYRPDEELEIQHGFVNWDHPSVINYEAFTEAVFQKTQELEESAILFIEGTFGVEQHPFNCQVYSCYTTYSFSIPFKLMQQYSFTYLNKPAKSDAFIEMSGCEIMLNTLIMCFGLPILHPTNFSNT